MQYRVEHYDSIEACIAAACGDDISLQTGTTADLPLHLYPVMLLAGQSVRMGTVDKLTLPFAQSTLAQTSIEQVRTQLIDMQIKSNQKDQAHTMRDVHLEQMIGVLNPQASHSLVNACDDMRRVYNQDAHMGQGSSIATASRVIISDAQKKGWQLSQIAALFCMGDQPTIPSGALTLLCQVASHIPLHQSSVVTIHLTHDASLPQRANDYHPIAPRLFVGCLPELATLNASASGRSIIHRFTRYNLYAYSQDACSDIDTPQDYEEVKQRYSTLTHTPIMLIGMSVE